jgi:outer membrane protein assembly factor BamB
VRPPFVIALLAVLSAGCAGNYRLEETRAEGAATTPADVLQLQWRKKMTTRKFLEFRPQEWSTAAFDQGGTLYLGSSAKAFLALRATDGRTRWVLRTGGAVASTPLYSPQFSSVFFGANDGRLYAANTRAGKVRWSYATQGTINRRPAYSEGFLLFTSSEGRVYGLDAETGKWKWQYERELPEGFTIQGYAGVAVDGSTAYTGFADGTLVALKAYSGDVVWTRSLSGGKSKFVDIDTTPVLAGGMLLVASYSSGVFAVSPDTGSVRWQFPVEGASGILVHGDRIFFSAPKMGVVALDLAGRLIWRQAMPKGVPSTPVALDDLLFISGTETGLYAVSARTGRLLQYFDPGHGISASPAVQGKFLTVLSNQGWLYTFQINPRYRHKS